MTSVRRERSELDAEQLPTLTREQVVMAFADVFDLAPVATETLQLAGVQ
jgi:hypothetical protein